MNKDISKEITNLISMSELHLVAAMYACRLIKEDNNYKNEIKKILIQINGIKKLIRNERDNINGVAEEKV